MEDGGKTMVAIIQGLRDTGLTFALLSGTRPQNSQKSRNKVAEIKSSVKTNTEFCTRSSSAQINDSYYASSYQVAHCRYIPSSPAQHIPEFPEQRRTPSRTKGNFKQVGCYGYRETSSAFKQQRNRESFCHSPSPSPPPGSFVASLRKYPMHPGKCSSLELVQRLLNYTQDKHLSGQNSQWRRSLAPRPSRSVKHKRASTLTSKTCRSVQTYTRVGNNTPVGEKPKGNSCNKNRNDARAELDQLSETYNYFKPPNDFRSSYTGPCSEVRYLNNIKSYIKKTIRQFVNQNPPITCPKIRSRYEAHRKIHHRQTDSTTNTINENEVNTEPMKAEETTMTEMKRKLKDCCLATPPPVGICPSVLNRYRKHRTGHHGNTEDVDEKNADTDNEPSERQEAESRYCKPPPGTKRSRSFSPFRRCLCQDKASEALTRGELSMTDHDATIRKWLEDLPVFADSTPENQKLHLEMLPKLNAKLKDLRDQVDYEEKAMNEIRGFISTLHLSTPRDENSSEIDEPGNDIRDAGMVPNPMTPEEKHKHARNLVNELNPKTLTKVRYITDGPATSLLEDSSKIPGNSRAVNTFVDKDFEKKVGQLKSENVDDDIKDAQIKTYSDPTSDTGSAGRSQLTKVNRSTMPAENDPNTEDNRSVTKNITKLLDNPAIPEHVKNKNRFLVQNFDKKLKELQSKSASDDDIEAEIRKLVDSMEAAGMPMTPKQKNEMIADMLNDVKSGKHKDSNNKNQNVVKNLDKFLENQAIPEHVKNKNRFLVQNFDEKLKELQSKNASDDVIEAEVRKLVDSMEAAGMPMTPKQKNQMIADMLKDVKSGKHEDVKAKSQRVVKNLDKLPDNPAIPKHVKNENQILVQNFDKKLKELQSKNASDDVIEAEIRKLVNSMEAAGMPMTPKQKNQMITDMLNDAKSGKHEDVKEKSQRVVNNLDKLLDNPAIPKHVKNKNQILVQNFDKTLKELQSKNASDDAIESEVRKLVDSMEAAGMPMTPKQKNQIIADMLNDLKSESKQRKRWDESIRNDKIKVSRPGSTSSESTSKNFEIVSPQEKRKLKEKITKQILDFNKDITGDEPTEIRNKRKKNAAQLADNITETMTNFDEKFVPIKDDKIMSEVTHHLEKEAFDTSEPINQLAKRLKRQLETIDFETSTPDSEIKNRRRGSAERRLRGDSEDDEESKSNVPVGKSKPNARSLLAETKYRQDSAAVIKTVDKWANSLPISKMNSSKKVDYEALKEELKDEINQIGLHNEPEVRDKIKNFLGNSPVDLKNIKDKEKFLGKQEDQLIATLKKVLQKERSPESGKFIELAVEQWMKTLDLPETDDGDQKEMIDEAKVDLVSTLLNDIINADKTPGKRIDEIYPDAIADFLEKMPTHSYQPEDIDQLAKSLQDTVNILSKKYSPTGEPVKRKAAEVLLEDITNWVKNLPIEPGFPQDETDKIRQTIESKLIHKIGELNMNPELLHDDFLYEDILGDEIDNILADIQSERIDNDQAKLKDELLDIVRKAKQKIRDENAGKAYKQQLCEAIAKIYPSINLGPEGQALFEVLKDTIADAFINMHYVGNEEQYINKLKNKINDEINTFLKDYLKTSCPASPLNTRKFIENLYDAMEKIKEPQTGEFREQVKLVKLKNEINSWVKGLPLDSQTGQDKLQTNKMINNLAKKLLDNENLRRLIPDDENDEKIKKEIMKFLGKLPLNTDDEESLDGLAENLMDNLRDTVEQRTLDAENRYSIQPAQSCSCTVHSIPSSTLSKEDRDHLDRIKQRTAPLQRISFNDASISPTFIDTSIQTDIERASLGTCPNQKSCLAQRHSSAQTPTRRMQAVGSQMHESNIDGPWSSVDCAVGPPRISPPCPATHRPSCSSMNQFRRPISPVTRSPCMSGAPKSYPRPCMPHQSQPLYANPRCSQRPCESQCRSCAPHLSPNYQMALKPTPCRPEQLLPTQVGIQCSVTDSSTPPHVMSDESNSSPQENLRPYQHIPHPYEPMPRRADQNYHRPKLGRQSSQQCTSSQQCLPQDMPSQRIIRKTQNDPNSTCPGSVSQMQWNRRSHQDSQPRKCVASHSNLPYEGQSCLELQNSSQFSPSQQMPWSRNSRLSYASPGAPEQYEAGPSSSFQNRVTHLGSFDKPRNHDWNKVQINRQSWDMRYGHCLVSDEECRQEGRINCSYRPKCGRYSGRRKPRHLDNDESMYSCARCHGVHCPYPSYLFFR